MRWCPSQLPHSLSAPHTFPRGLPEVGSGRLGRWKVGCVIAMEPTHILWLIQVSVGDLSP